MGNHALLPMTKFWQHHRQVFLGVIVFAVILLRAVYGLWQNVSALNQDEAALLLNARFIWESGHDEWQQAWPLVFTSFGDFKLPGYIYGTALVGGLFGWHTWTVRLLSWIAGLVNLVFIYHLGKRLFHSPRVGYLAALLTLVSPWSWHYSSIGFEANVGLAFFLGSLLLVLRTKPTWWSVLATFGGIVFSGLTYNSPLLLSPLLIWVLFWTPGQKKKKLVSGVVVVMAAALVLGLTWPATQQKQGISLFSDATLIAAYPEYRAQFTAPWQQTVLGNQYVYFGQRVLENVIQSFSWEFLVWRGGENPWHTLPDTGHIHFIIPILVALGCGWLLRLGSERRTWQQAVLIGGLFLGALAPAAITVDAPHATRSLFFFVMITVVAAGTWRAIERRLGQGRWLQTLQTGFVLAVIAGWLVWWWPARMHWREGLSVGRRWNVGLEAALTRVPATSTKTVYIQDPDGVLYTRVALAEKFTAQDFWSQVERSAPDSAGIIRVKRLGKYVFVSEVPIEVSGYYLRPENGQEWAMIEL